MGLVVPILIQNQFIDLGKVNGVFQTYFTSFQEKEVMDLSDSGHRVEAP